jgi:hypothetical protein
MGQINIMRSFASSAYPVIWQVYLYLSLFLEQSPNASDKRKRSSSPGHLLFPHFFTGRTVSDGQQHMYDK